MSSLAGTGKELPLCGTQLLCGAAMLEPQTPAPPAPRRRSWWSHKCSWCPHTRSNVHTDSVWHIWYHRYNTDINFKLGCGFEWNDWLSSWFPFFIIYKVSNLPPGHGSMHIKRCDIIMHHPMMSSFNISSNSGNRFMPDLVLGCTQSCYRTTGADLPKWVLPRQSSKPSIGPCHFLSIKCPELKLLGLWWFMACITSHQAPPVRVDCLRQDFHALAMATPHLQPLLPSCYAKTVMRIQVSGWQALVSHWFVGVRIVLISFRTGLIARVITIKWDAHPMYTVCQAEELPRADHSWSFWSDW